MSEESFTQVCKRRPGKDHSRRLQAYKFGKVGVGEWDRHRRVASPTEPLSGGVRQLRVHRQTEHGFPPLGMMAVTHTVHSEDFGPDEDKEWPQLSG